MNDKFEETCEATLGSNRERGAASKEDKLKVICPHYEVCEFGKLKAKNNRYRCHGTLIEAVTEAARVALAYKCEKSKKVMTMVLNGNKVWHIKPESVEHDWLSGLLRPIKCDICERRIFDVHIFMGRAKIHIKCPRDGLQLQFDLVADGQQHRQKH